MFFFQNNTNLTFKPKSVEHAYLAILQDDLKSALQVFSEIESPRAKWGISLCEILSGYLKHYPTFFQIRNFLEIDLDFLLKNEKIDYVESVLGSIEILAEINQEAFKFASRVMLENKFYKAAEKYMEKSKAVFYNDPELHFMYANYYMKIGNYEGAKYHNDECLRILPEYFPAKQLRENLLNLP